MVTKQRPSLKDGAMVPEKKRRLEERCKNCHSIFIYYRNKKKKISPKSFCNILCQREFKRNVALKKNKELFGPYEEFTAVPKVRKELLLRLRKNFSMVLLSNTNETHIRAFSEIVKKDIGETSLLPLFDKVYYSNEIGFRKPNANAFEFVLAQNNFIAEETLLVVDSIQHLKGAELLGIKTLHVMDDPVETLFANFLA